MCDLVAAITRKLGSIFHVMALVVDAQFSRLAIHRITDLALVLLLLGFPPFACRQLGRWSQFGRG